MNTTCATTYQLYGNRTVDNVTSSPLLCCQFCQENYPSAAYTDYWGSSDSYSGTPWCSCYLICNVTRCTSTECLGDDGGDTLTQAIPISPPPPPEPPVSCGSAILDTDTTCTVDDRFFGGYSEDGLMDTVYLCCDFCRENYPNSTHIDWWYNGGDTPWCNCYSNCNDYRCVSKDCWGYDGGDVETW
eukprot:gene30230-37760_t